MILDSKRKIFQVKNKKQLFIDEKFIDSSNNVTLTMNPPYMSEIPILVPDKPWENRIGSYNTVIKDNDLFRMWYDFTPPENDPSGITRGVAYAESTDGIHWEKPNIGLIEICGSKSNNVVIPRVPNAPRGETEGGTVFLDTNPNCSRKEKYKFWTKIRGIPQEDQARGMNGPFWQMYSSDGINWNTYNDRIETEHSDTQNVPFWDDKIKKYVGFGRTRNPYKGFKVRGIGRIESTNFHDWSKMEEVFRVEESDWRTIPSLECSQRLGGYVDVYTNAASKYEFAEDVYLMLPSFLYHWECIKYVKSNDLDEDDMHINFPDTSDIKLLTSRDGVNWKQSPGKQSFLRLGLSGKLRSKQIYTSPGFIKVEDELWNYCSGSNRNHSGQLDLHADQLKSGIFRNISRLDGFISADTPYNGGWLKTPPIFFKGSKLYLNIDTSAGGSAKIEFQDLSGKPIKNFSIKNCDTINGNSVEMPVSFDGKTNLNDLAEKPVQIYIETYDTKLYGFQFL